MYLICMDLKNGSKPFIACSDHALKLLGQAGYSIPQMCSKQMTP